MKLKLNLSFGFKNDRLSLCISEADRPEKRNYLSVEKELRLFDKNGFDSRLQKFKEDSRNAKSNNRILADIMRRSVKKIEEGKAGSGREAVILLKRVDRNRSGNVSEKAAAKTEAKSGEDKTPVLTLEKWIKELSGRTSFRAGALPSTNRARYQVLYNKTRGGFLADVPINSITKSDVLEFARRWAETYPKSYDSDMATFSAAINRAYKEGLRDEGCPSSWREYAPVSDFSLKDAAEGVSVLTVDEYEFFCEFIKSEFNAKKRLYYDVCVLIYELKMRPIDVLRIRKSGISGEGYVYLPTKKKNIKARQRHVVKVSFTERASLIIQKYWNSTDNDYLLPFKGNLSDPDLSSPSEYMTYIGKVKNFTHGISYCLRCLDWIGHDRGTAYLFRHSAFTHEINACKKPIMQIAKEGGTSVAMLEKHYYNYFVK